MQMILHIVGITGQNSLIAYQFYRQSTEEDKLNDVPNQSEDESLCIINGLHYFVVVVHNGMF
jgi:pantothenate kinase